MPSTLKTLVKPNGNHKPTPPLKWHGGKHYLARRIVALMPPHRHYCEPFAGGLAVLLAKNPHGVSEVVNDLDGRLTNFWRVLQGVDSFHAFMGVLAAVPFSEVEWSEAGESLEATDPVARAVAFFIRCRQSLAGRMDSFAPLSKNRTRRGTNSTCPTTRRAAARRGERRKLFGAILRRCGQARAREQSRIRARRPVAARPLQTACDYSRDGSSRRKGEGGKVLKN